jgi:hypothetical protein
MQKITFAISIRGLFVHIYLHSPQRLNHTSSNITLSRSKIHDLSAVTSCFRSYRAYFRQESSGRTGRNDSDKAELSSRKSIEISMFFFPIIIGTATIKKVTNVNFPPGQAVRTGSLK